MKFTKNKQGIYDHTEKHLQNLYLKLLNDKMGNYDRQMAAFELYKEQISPGPESKFTRDKLIPKIQYLFTLEDLPAPPPKPHTDEELAERAAYLDANYFTKAQTHTIDGTTLVYAPRDVPLTTKERRKVSGIKSTYADVCEELVDMDPREVMCRMIWQFTNKSGTNITKENDEYGCPYKEQLDKGIVSIKQLIELRND